MNNFNFYSPTKLYFGKETEREIGKIIKSYNFNNVAFVYGKSSIKSNGLYDIVVNSLNNENISFIELSGVEANPKLSLVKKFKEQIKDKQIDLILAVGGGSVIDTAKSLAHAINYVGNPFDFNIAKAKPNKVIPVGVILTISAAGSELSDSCVISNDEVNPYYKKGFNSESNRPLFAICNPELTYSVSKFQTGCGIVDILMHTLERYMNPNDSCMLSEEFAFGLIKTVLHYGKTAINNPNDYEARANLMLASSFSHNGLTGLGKKQAMRVHGLEHTLSGCYDEVAHGEGLAILWPAWCKYVLDNENANKQLRRLAKVVFNKDTALEGIDELISYFNEIGMPTSLKQLNLKSPLDIEKMAISYSDNKTKVIKDFKDLNYDSFIEIYKLAL